MAVVVQRSPRLAARWYRCPLAWAKKLQESDDDDDGDDDDGDDDDDESSMVA